MNILRQSLTHYRTFTTGAISRMKAKKFIMASVFDGAPKPSDFKLEVEELPALEDGEILCEAEYLSVDPYMRKYMMNFPAGTLMMGGQVAKIIDTRNAEFPQGSYVFGTFGWRTHTVVDPSANAASLVTQKPYILPDFGSHPRSLGLGYCGMPGNTAYFGFLEFCQPKSGETVVVTGAAGAVGTVVGQIAKIKGCRVVGFAGGDDKCEWLKNELGFDEAINYKNGNIEEALKIAAPNGVDCFYDNVGGVLGSQILNQMNLFGRVAICGTIASNNLTPDQWPTIPIFQPTVLAKQLSIQGFNVYRWIDRWMEGVKQNTKWIQEGKIKYRETVTQGFENMPTALIEMLRGANFGKAVVKV